MKGRLIKQRHPRQKLQEKYKEKQELIYNLGLVEQNHEAVMKLHRMAKRLGILIKIDGIPFGADKKKKPTGDDTK